MPKPNKNTYVVKGGDNLSKIAKDIYGDARMFAEIQRNNPWFNGVLKPGQVLKLPAKRSNPFVSNTEAAAAGMLGGTAETGYGFTGERAGELNALSSGVRDTGRQINPNTPWGFNQASQLAQQYYGGAGSQVGAPPAPNATQMAAKTAAGQGGSGVAPLGYGNNQPVRNDAFSQRAAPSSQGPVQGPQYPGAAATGIGAPSRDSGMFASQFGNSLAPTVSAPVQPRLAQGPQQPPAQGPQKPAATPGSIAPAAVSQPNIYQHGSYQVNQQKAAALYSTLQTGADGKLGPAAPQAITGSDFANLAMQTGIPMSEFAANLEAAGYVYDRASTSFYIPDKDLANYGVSGAGLFWSAPSEFAGLPPVTPPSGYGPPRPIYTGTGRRQTGLATPPMAESGNATANWNIGP